jgi:hypothetical protein
VILKVYKCEGSGSRDGKDSCPQREEAPKLPEGWMSFVRSPSGEIHLLPWDVKNFQHVCADCAAAVINLLPRPR